MSNTNLSHLTGEQLEVLKSFVTKIQQPQIPVNTNVPVPAPNVTPPVNNIVSSSMNILGYTIQKKYLYIAGILIVAIVIFLLWRWWKNRKNDTDTESEEDYNDSNNQNTNYNMQHHIPQYVQQPVYNNTHNNTQSVPQNINDQPTKPTENIEDNKEKIVEELEN